MIVVVKEQINSLHWETRKTIVYECKRAFRIEDLRSIFISANKADVSLVSSYSPNQCYSIELTVEEAEELIKKWIQFEEDKECPAQH